MDFTKEKIFQALSPYHGGFPKPPGIQPGMTISAHNWQAAQDVLPAELLERVKDGDLNIAVAETWDYLLHEHYRERQEEIIRYLEERSDGYAILTNTLFRNYLLRL